MYRFKIEKKEEFLEGRKIGYIAEIISPIGIVDDYYNLIHRHNKNFYFLCKTSLFVGKKLDEYEKNMIEKLVWMDIDTAIEAMKNMDVSASGIKLQ